MSSHFLFHSEVSETIPFNAKYAFPTQASRVIMSTSRICPITQPTMGSVAAPLNSSAKGRLVQIKLPAQGYLNPLESYLRFDMYIVAAAGATNCYVNAPRILAAGAHGCFRRLRILYGGMVVEDIQLYNTLVRMLTNVAVGEGYADNVGCILEGMGSDAQRAALFHPISRDGVTASQFVGTLLNNSILSTATARPIVQPNGPVAIIQSDELVNGASGTIFGSGGVKHTFCISLASGMLTQQKLLPLKWMANQLMIELELEEPAGFLVTGATAEVPTLYETSSLTVPWQCLSPEIVPAQYNAVAARTANAGVVPYTLSADATYMNLNYFLDNIYFVANILEFDASYDAAFFKGMATGGVPIKFASWHTHQHIPTGTQATLIIQERARSVKSIFCMLRKRGDIQAYSGSGNSFLSDPYWTYPGVTPSSGVWYDDQCGIYEFQLRVGGRYFPSQPVRCTFGGTEPLAELQKALNVLGDYQLSAPTKPENWWRWRGLSVMAIELESSNGFELSGVNAEELADLQFIISLPSGSPGFDSDNYTTTFVHYDAMLIIRPNNIVEKLE